MATTLTLVVISLTVTTIAAVRQYLGRAANASLVFFGSGGHTGEMIRMIKLLDKDMEMIKPMKLAYSAGDDLSIRRISMQLPTIVESSVISIPRARTVGQSWISTPFTSVESLFVCITLLVSSRPRVLMSNGPGTGLMLILAARLLRTVGLQTRVIYIESLARVNSLSLTGRLAYYIVDRFIVQWPDLQEQYPAAECYGILV